MSGSEHKAEGGSRTREGHGDDTAIEDTIPRGKVLPLDSRRMMSAHVKQIAESLGLPTTGLNDEVRQVIEGNSKTPDIHNMQVVVEETQTISLKVLLMDEEDGFLEFAPLDKLCKKREKTCGLDSLKLSRKMTSCKSS